MNFLPTLHQGQMNNLLHQPHDITEPVKLRWATLQDLLNQKLFDAGQSPFPPVRCI